jgi:hypothetical protein
VKKMKRKNVVEEREGRCEDGDIYGRRRRPVLRGVEARMTYHDCLIGMFST